MSLESISQSLLIKQNQGKSDLEQDNIQSSRSNKQNSFNEAVFLKELLSASETHNDKLKSLIDQLSIQLSIANQKNDTIEKEYLIVLKEQQLQIDNLFKQNEQLKNQNNKLNENNLEYQQQLQKCHFYYYQQQQNSNFNNNKLISSAHNYQQNQQNLNPHIISTKRCPDIISIRENSFKIQHSSDKERFFSPTIPNSNRLQSTDQLELKKKFTKPIFEQQKENSQKEEKIQNHQNNQQVKQLNILSPSEAINRKQLNFPHGCTSPQGITSLKISYLTQSPTLKPSICGVNENEFKKPLKNNTNQNINNLNVCPEVSKVMSNDSVIINNNKSPRTEFNKQQQQQLQQQQQKQKIEISKIEGNSQLISSQNKQKNPYFKIGIEQQNENNNFQNFDKIQSKNNSQQNINEKNQQKQEEKTIIINNNNIKLAKSISEQNQNRNLEIQISIDNNNSNNNNQISEEQSSLNDTANMQSIDFHSTTDQYHNIDQYCNKIHDFSSKKTQLFQQTHDLLRIENTINIQKIFQEFFILGIDEIKKQNILKSGQNQICTSEILFQYKSEKNNNLNQIQNNFLPQFIFPFDVQTQISQDHSKLHDILNSNIKPFIYSFKNQQSYNNIQNLQQQQMSKQQALCNQDDLVGALNSSKNFYLIGFIITDFTFAKTNTKNKNNQNQNQQNYKKQYLVSERAFCFTSYLPLSELFFKIILQLKLEINNKRQQLISQQGDHIYDSHYFDSIFIENIQKTLATLLKIKLNTFSQKIQLEMFLNLDNNNNQYIIDYQLPPQSTSHLQEIEFFYSKVLCQLDLDQFVFLYLSSLLETPIVFVHPDITILSSLILFFQNMMIKPLNQIIPVIFSLPQNNIALLDSPVPMIVGILREGNYIKKMNFDKVFKNQMFVLLDKFQILNNIIQQEIYSDIFNVIKERIKTDFQQCKLEGQQNEKQRKLSFFNLIKSLEGFLQYDILIHLPSSPAFYQSKQSQPSSQINNKLDFDKILNDLEYKLNYKFSKFLQRFSKTQMFTCFIEEKYLGYK